MGNIMRRAHARTLACALITAAALGAAHASAAGAARAVRVADIAAERPAGHVSRAVADRSVDRASQADGAALSYTDEFDRAELIDQMLKECRGVRYNAYELALTSGEKLRLPAPIQLVVIRVKHPYCAELLRTYAPRTAV